MLSAYDLILLDQGQFQIATIQVNDAADAWRFGCERYPRIIRGVVCQDPPQLAWLNLARNGSWILL